MRFRRIKFIAPFVLLLVVFVVVPTVLGGILTVDFPTDTANANVFVRLNAGDTIQATLVCTGNNDADPIIFGVFGPNGNFIASDDDGFTPCDDFNSSIVNFVAPATGCYRFNVGDLDANFDGGPMTLTIDSTGAVKRLSGCSTSGNGAVAGAPCSAVGDGRINNHPDRDCAAPIAIYPTGDGSFEIWAVDENTGNGSLALPFNDTGVEGLLDSTTHPFSGRDIQVFILDTGEIQVMTQYANGKNYTVVFSGDGSDLYHLES